MLTTTQRKGDSSGKKKVLQQLFTLSHHLPKIIIPCSHYNCIAACHWQNMLSLRLEI